MTKKSILIALIALFCVGTASAKLRFGVKAGLNLDNIKLTSDVGQNLNSDNKCGFTVGGMMEATVPVVGIGFDLSLMYTHMNADVANGANSGVVNKNFLEIPLNLKYKMGIPVISNFLQPYLFTGPTMALKLDKSTFENIKTKTVQMGWNVGLGFEVMKRVQIGGGYTFGINNVAKYIPVLGDNINTVKDVKIKNNYWTVTAAVLF